MCQAPSTGVRMLSRSMLLLMLPSVPGAQDPFIEITTSRKVKLLMLHATRVSSAKRIASSRQAGLQTWAEALLTSELQLLCGCSKHCREGAPLSRKTAGGGRP